ncbi:MAG: Mbov_0396 family ICE element transmembrane protein [Candidatus Coproplasma sp.]
MFDWFWEFLYSLSKTIFRLIDGLVSCANKLCGVDTVKIDGNDTDFMYYLLSNDKISFAFKVAALLGMIVLVIFTIFAIIRSIVKEKPEGTPGQICIKAFKAFLMFLFVPTCMFAVMWLGNTFMRAMYTATTQGSTSIGSFLFVSFAQDVAPPNGLSNEYAQQFLNGSLDYYNTEQVTACMNIGDYSFLFSWLAGGVILVSLAGAMVLFVDRVLSIIILYIVAPFSISTVVIDDGAHFKLWRDQILVKFFMGYGAIIALNIYAMVVSLVMNPSLQFFQNSFLNILMKLLLIGGGAVTLKKSMGLIGNLVQAGAGSNEMRDNAIAASGLRRALGTIGGGLATVSGLNFAKGVIGEAVNMKKKEYAAGILNTLGLGNGKSSTGGAPNAGGKGEEGDSDSKNDDKPKFNGNQNAVKDAIGGNNSNGQNNQLDNKNGSQPLGFGNQMVNDAINNQSDHLQPRKGEDADDDNKFSLN